LESSTSSGSLSVFKGTAGSGRREEVGQDLFPWESPGAWWIHSGGLCSRGAPLGNPAPPHPLMDLLIETPFHFCFIYLLAKQ
jgi:hypothetical protein